METETKRAPKHSYTWKTLLYKLPFLLLIPLGLQLPNLTSNMADTIEQFYSLGAYPYIVRIVGAVFSFLPFSFAEIIVFSVIVGASASVIINLLKLLWHKTKVVRVAHRLVSLLISCGFFLNMFYLLWGLNYNRLPLANTMNLNVTSRSAEQLEILCYTLKTQAEQLRAILPEDDNGVFIAEGKFSENAKKIQTAYEKLGESNSLFSAPAYPVKPVASSKLLSYSGLSGIYFPFTAEGNINIDQPDMLLFSTAAHETAHQYAIAREDEANFVAYLACIHSDDPALKYSGIMLALISCGNKLYEADADKYTLLYSSYSEAIKRDLSDHNDYWNSFEGPVEETMTEVNDNYLKHNQQPEGVKSYGAMVDLLLAYYFDQ